MKNIYRKILAAVAGLLLISSGLNAQEQVYGEVLYHNDYGIEDVTVYLSGRNGHVIASTTTDIDGYFEFNNVDYGNYTLTAETSQDPSGVDLEDSYALLMHLWGLNPLDPIQQLAADVNGNGNINWGDYYIMVIVYFTQGNPFPMGDWVFEEVDISVTGARSWSTPLGGTACGDIAVGATPDKINVENPVDNQEYVYTEAFDTFDIEFKSNQAINTLGFHLDITLPENLDIMDVESTLENLNYDVANNTLKITWIDQDMNTRSFAEGDNILTLKALYKGAGENIELELQSNDMSHFLNEEGKVEQGVSLTIPGIKISGPVVREIASNDITEKVYPNPFIDHVTFDYELGVAGNLRIELYNTSGQLVKVILDDYQQEGSHMINVNTEELLAGYYVYKMYYQDKNGSVKTGSMIKIR